jgi:hypothetical protein
MGYQKWEEGVPHGSNDGIVTTTGVYDLVQVTQVPTARHSLFVRPAIFNITEESRWAEHRIPQWGRPDIDPRVDGHGM